MENRARLVLEVVDAVSQEWSAERIGIRVSPIGSFQNVDNGPNEEEDALYLISELAKRGIAYLHMSEPGETNRGSSDTCAAERTVRHAGCDREIVILRKLR